MKCSTVCCTSNFVVPRMLNTNAGLSTSSLFSPWQTPPLTHPRTPRTNNINMKLGRENTQQQGLAKLALAERTTQVCVSKSTYCIHGKHGNDVVHAKSWSYASSTSTSGIGTRKVSLSSLYNCSLVKVKSQTVTHELGDKDI